MRVKSGRRAAVAAGVGVMLGALAGAVLAQYPQISDDMRMQAEAAKAEADRRSDDAFARALPEIEAWAKKGKPFIQDASRPGDLPQATIPAFPGAEGGGRHAFGGRGGRVFVVTSLDDSGPGTFREACEAGGPRIVVFNVAGIIRLEDRIRIRAPYITIDGSSAPGDGVCIAGNTVELDTHDVVVRHMRFRRGETDVRDRNDSIGGNPIGNIMIDHVSASWGLDENMSMYRHMYRPPDGAKDLKLPTVNITIQNSIFSEGLNTYHHAFGSTIGGTNCTFMRNLWANNTGRNPSMGMGGDFTFVNNVIFNWRHRTTDGGDGTSRVNSIANYFKPGPGTPTDRPIGHRILKAESRTKPPAEKEFGRFYVAGNVIEGNEGVTADNWAGGVQFADEEDVKGESLDAYNRRYLSASRAAEPFPMAPLRITTAQEAYEEVLAGAGATLPRRDAVDERIVKTVRTGDVGPPVAEPDLFDKLDRVKYTAERVRELVKLVPLGFITDPAQVGGYPEYRGAAHADADGDGMPDGYEQTHGLNPADAADAAADPDGDGYTNIEAFLYRIGKAG